MAMMQSQVTRFLLAGGSAAAVNWLARIALSLFLPFMLSILLAYGLGMLAGFFLYRWFVFQRAAAPLGRQVAVFLAVNALGASVVVAATYGLEALIEALPVRLDTRLVEALSHGLGIGVGAVANYLGHSTLTFGAAPIPATSRRP